MKLVFLIDSTRKIGGGSYSQFVFAKHMALRGHQVTIFAGDKNFYSDELEIDNLVVYYRKSIPEFRKGLGIGLINNIWRYIYRQIVILPFLRKEQPDWLIGYLHRSAIDASHLGKLLQIKVANFVYETPDWREGQMGTKFNKSEKKYFERHKTAYQNSTVLVPNSKLSALYMKKWIPEARITSPVYPGINSIKIEDKTRDYDIVFIGRLHKLKNVDQLLAACSTEHSIVIIGDGAEMSNLKSLAAKLGLRVDFLGSVKDDVKWEYLNRSKLLVCPTSFEGFGMPPLEALACGCKVLCSDIPILKEVYGSDVEYFELNNIIDLSNKINRLVNSNQVVKSNLPKVYTWENAAISIENLLLSAE